MCELKRISIHAPPRGATVQVLAQRDAIVISIHAPPRGATRGRLLIRRRSGDFNSRPSARGDAKLKELSDATAADFNSRPSARGDLSSKRISAPQYDFNSRPSARGDPAVSRVVFLPFVFQFTPLREGRLGEVGGEDVTVHISIHAPPRGATRWLYTQPSFSRHFNSRPSARGDQCRR